MILQLIGADADSCCVQVDCLTDNFLEFARYLAESARRSFEYGDQCDSLLAEAKYFGRQLGQMLESESPGAVLTRCKAGTELRILARLGQHWIPWELIRFRDDECLGQTFAVCRLVTPMIRNLRSDGSCSGLALVLQDRTDDLISVNSEHLGVVRRLRQMQYRKMLGIRDVQSNHSSLQVEDLITGLTQAEIVHFCGHCDERSGVRCLRLTHPGHEPCQYVGPQDILALKRVPRMVFLNACGAVAIPDQRETADGRVHCLVESLLERGAKTVIGPQVPVLDSRTGPLVDLFYSAMTDGNSPVQALWSARRECIKRNPWGLLESLSCVVFESDGA